VSADNFNLRDRHSHFAGKKRAQLGICLAALRGRRDADLQRSVRELARDFGFRTLGRYLHPQRRRPRVSDPLLEEFMHGGVRGGWRPRFAQSIELRCLPPAWWPNQRRCSWWRRTAGVESAHPRRAIFDGWIRRARTENRDRGIQ
jgi:hypothetical protein